MGFRDHEFPSLGIFSVTVLFSWAYDIGYGGLDHVLQKGENVNVVVLVSSSSFLSSMLTYLTKFSFF